MTKTVRIENADTNTSVKVKVKAQHKTPEGEWVDSTLPVESLDFPTAMVQMGIHDTRRLVVYEEH